MGSLSCSTISLHTGAIKISQGDLTLQGPSGRVTITGKYNGSVQHSYIFGHSGKGTLRLTDLDITYGAQYSSAGSVGGGCIASAGSVHLLRTTVSKCTAQSTVGRATGGGIAAAGNIAVEYSTISGNSAISSGKVHSYGGGVWAAGNFTARYSTISGNQSSGSAGYGLAGGVYARKNVDIFASTISGNRAEFEAGGMAVFSKSPAAYSVYIHSSTISGNSAHTNAVGGVASDVPVVLRNSTIAFNTAATNKSGPYFLAAGLTVIPSYGSISADLRSSLLSSNTYGTNEADFAAISGGGKTVTVSGANNMIGVATSGAPPGTILNQCPLLGSLRNNGGPTQTHALLSHSPAIDAGSSPAGLAFDQRGSPYARVDHGAADIGAYELQQNDIVFNNGFDGCP
ncbi:choice-of-anchor Q domain-containing protein [Dokdonella soli]